jgi:hypothetical protein
MFENPDLLHQLLSYRHNADDWHRDVMAIVMPIVTAMRPVPVTAIELVPASRISRRKRLSDRRLPQVATFGAGIVSREPGGAGRNGPRRDHRNDVDCGNKLPRNIHRLSFADLRILRASTRD